VDNEWQRTFRNPMRRFEKRRSLGYGERSVSIKIRVTSGCFHREHSPMAYQLIDQYLTTIPGDNTMFSFQEHESGPELLVYFAVGTAGITLAKSVIDLITTIIKSRSEGVKKGDRPSDPIELIVRRVEGGSEVRHEVVLRIGHKDPVDSEKLEKLVKDAVGRLIIEKDSPKDT
jgi:hypothetical protein